MIAVWIGLAMLPVTVSIDHFLDNHPVNPSRPRPLPGPAPKPKPKGA